MAAPTSVRVEAVSQASTKLRWAYTGGNTVGVYISTNGTDYTLIETIASGTLIFTDEDLTAATKYWYKLSDDVGSTFSDVVTVWTHECFGTGANNDMGLMPRFGEEDDDWASPLNEMAERIENALGRQLDPEECAACPDDGRVVIDCSNGCTKWVIIADEDINSISIQWCEEGIIDVVVPPGTDVGICGWPAGFGFTGDECNEAPMSGGDDGRTASVPSSGGGANPSRSKPGTGKKPKKQPSPSTGGGGGGGCVCTPGSKNQLTVKCCTSNCSIACSSTKKLELRACGGNPPYTWSASAGTVSPLTGVKTTLTPPANAGSAVAGVAYRRYGKFNSSSAGSCSTDYIRSSYLCSDAEGGASCVTNTCSPTEACNGDDVSNCSQFDCVPGCTLNPTLTCNGAQLCPAQCGSAESTCKFCQSNCTDVQRGSFVCDIRTVDMINAGCAPCGVAMNGATVTCTDSIGTAVVTTIKPG